MDCDCVAAVATVCCGVRGIDVESLRRLVKEVVFLERTLLVSLEESFDGMNGRWRREKGRPHGQTAREAQALFRSVSTEIEEEDDRERARGGGEGGTNISDCMVTSKRDCRCLPIH